MHARWLASPALLLLLVLGFSAFAEVAVPPLRSPVTDLTGTLTPEQIATLDQQLRAFEAKKGRGQGGGAFATEPSSPRSERTREHSSASDESAPGRARVESRGRT